MFVSSWLLEEKPEGGKTEVQTDCVFEKLLTGQLGLGSVTLSFCLQVTGEEDRIKGRSLGPWPQ
jgi:hypothetical protein